MTSLKNALEEIVVLEVQDQIKKLKQPISQEISVSEVAAFALNRLPTLYASTSRGWLQQRKRAHNEFKHQIVSAVQQGLLGVRRDPLRQSTQIASEKIETPAHILVKLQKLFNKPSLLWNSVPQAFQEALGSVVSKPDLASVSITDRQRLRDIKGYLQRKGSISHTAQQPKDDYRDWQTATNSQLPDPELNSYLISASYFLVNVLESLVTQEVPNQLNHMENVLPRKVSIDDVSAHALNRLPAMYATSEQGVIWQTQKAKERLSTQIESTVIQSLMTLSKTPRRPTDPIPLLKYEQECEQAIEQLRQIFQRGDITWRNVATLVESALEYEKQGFTSWRQQWRMLGQIYSEMYLKSGDAELSLVESESGEVLVVKTHTKEAFGWLADNPKNLGISTLRLFPAVAEIALYASFLDFPITYTREEMAIDGII
ncbi:late competence development ComFB family protein [Pseudanabaena mucicola]|uniref:Late competence development ComFB family protein n=1 Tax=Pseudanabaena mucicola FACHB-723 TaxID=2692860 RepID=A0ABR7ZS06_9CYAN|nr:late competence development ComFB family protein [Pseudanabaena mucicola]MBD2186550.1 late competence development ComFB family protein [Pseudanabaena mucicola FACHB-723]